MPDPDVRPDAQSTGEAVSPSEAQPLGDKTGDKKAGRLPGGRLGTSARRQLWEDAVWSVASGEEAAHVPSKLRELLEAKRKKDPDAFLERFLAKVLPAPPREMPIPAPESGGRKGDVAADNEEDLKVSLERLQRFHDAINPKVVEE